MLSNLGKALNTAMKDIEAENPDIAGTLPKNYNQLDNSLLIELLKSINSLPDDITTDAFGRIYEYFLGKFAMAEGQKGGEFFTPTCLVRLIVEIIEPYHGRIYDPACGSGGMFVQSGEFVAEHKKNPGSEISIFGQEKTGETVNLAKMNLAVHGLSGDIRETNTFYNDLHNSVGRFDFCMAIVEQACGDWMKQMAKNLTDPMCGFLKHKKYLVHDRDRLYTKVFMDMLHAAGVETIKSMPLAPNFSPFIERFVRSIKSECLERMLIFGEAHLQYCIEQYVQHYHQERPHQGLGNEIISPQRQGTGRIECQERLGGLLKFYRKVA